jgi:peptidoglycan/LPS O-acetylase OafA/YrhL
LRNNDDKNFNIVNFYSNRVNRIFPSLIVIFITISVWGWFFLLPNELKNLGQHLKFGSIFLSNIILLKEVDYFNSAAHSKILLHLWSLSIEEQYYIFWPLFLSICLRYKYGLVSILLIMILSFSFNIYYVEIGKNNTAFFMPMSRLWELMAGSILAYWIWKTKYINIDNKISNIYSILGFALIVLSLFFIRDNNYPGWKAIFPIIGTVCIIFSGSESWLSRNLLRNKIAIFIGMISYPLYLWHWVLLYIFDTTIFSYNNHLASKFIAITLSFLFSIITFFIIEYPIRFGLFKNFKYKVNSLLIIIMAMVGFYGHFLFVNNGFPDRVDPILSNLPDINREISIEWRRRECFLDPDQDIDAFKRFCNHSGTIDNQNILWGDSHAAALYPGLHYVSENISQYTASLCPPVIFFRSVERPYCHDINQGIYDKLKNGKTNLLILHGNWLYLSKLKDWEQNLKLSISLLKELNIQKILLVGPVPQWKKELPRLVMECNQNSPAPAYSNCGLIEEIDKLDIQVKNIADQMNVSYFSVYNLLCIENRCKTKLDDKNLYYFDSSHLTPLASLHIVNEILDHVKK